MTVYEWSKILKTPLPLKIDPTEDQAMWDTWIDFCRERNMDQVSIPFDHDEWFDWLKYSATHYQKPLPIAKETTDWNG